MNAYKIRAHKREPDPEDIERLAAADLLMNVRRVEQLRLRLTADEREAYAKRFEAVALECTNAASAMRMYAPEPGLPGYLDPTSSEYLRPDAQARFHT